MFFWNFFWFFGSSMSFLPKIWFELFGGNLVARGRIRILSVLSGISNFYNLRTISYTILTGFTNLIFFRFNLLTLIQLTCFRNQLHCTTVNRQGVLHRSFSVLCYHSANVLKSIGFFLFWLLLKYVLPFLFFKFFLIFL